MKVVSAEFARAAHERAQLCADGLPQIAFIGRSNVGKSSLMNALLGRKGLARTSSTPGRTRAINYFLINRQTYFVDLPGYGYAKAARTDRQEWARLIAEYFESARRASGPGTLALVLQLVDSKVGATDLDVEGHRYLAGFGAPVEVVATKIDRLGRGTWSRVREQIRKSLGLKDAERPILASAESGEGMRELWKTIDEHLLRRGCSTNQ